MTKIDDILDRLQKEQPVIDMPDELTERIMNSLPERRPEATAGQKTQKAWLYTTIGAAAASIMLLLTLHQISPDVGGRQQPVVAQHTDVHSEKRIAPPDTKDASAPLPATASAQSDKQNVYMETTAGKGNPHQQNAKNASFDYFAFQFRADCRCRRTYPYSHSDKSSEEDKEGDSRHPWQWHLDARGKRDKSHENTGRLRGNHRPGASTVAQRNHRGHVPCHSAKGWRHPCDQRGRRLRSDETENDNRHINR